MRHPIVLVAFLGACQLSLDVPADAQIQCGPNGECPGELVCAKTVDRCVDPKQATSEGPGLEGEAQLSPLEGTLGTSFELRFSVNRALATDPKITLDTGARTPPWILVEEETDRSARAYVFAYEVDGTEASGPREVLATLVDTYGRTSVVSLESPIIDFAPPRLETPLEVVYLKLGAGDSITPTFDEPVRAPIEVVMRGGAADIAWAVDEAGTASYVATDTAGVYDLEVTALDAAGNTGTATLGTVVLDYTPPGITVVAPESVRPGDRLEVVVNAGEDFGGTPAAALVPDAGATLALEAPLFGVQRLTFSHTVLPSEEGTFTLQLSGLQDRAGNLPSQVPSPSIRIDGTPPSLSSIVIPDTVLKAGETLSVTLTADEPLSQPPVVAIKDVELDFLSGSGAGPYAYELLLDDPALTGSWQLFVSVIDAVGFTSFFTPEVITIDAQAPRVIDVSFSPSSANASSQIFLLLTVDEALADLDDDPLVELPDLTLGFDAAPGMGPLGGFELVSRAGLNYVFQLPPGACTGAEPCTYVLETIRLTDSAGNNQTYNDLSLPALPVSLSIDSEAPSIVGVTVSIVDRDGVAQPAEFEDLLWANTQHLIDDGSVRIDLTVLDDVVGDERPTVLVGTASADCALQTASPTSAVYRCEYPLDPEDQDGLRLVSITASDAAGNPETLSSLDAGGPPSVTFDFTPPSVAFTGVTFLPGLLVEDDELTLPDESVANPLPPPQLGAITYGTTVNLQWTASEPVRLKDAPLEPELFIGDGAAASFDGSCTVPGGGLESTTGPFLCSFSLPRGVVPAQGQHAVFVRMRDRAGNESFLCGGVEAVDTCALHPEEPLTTIGLNRALLVDTMPPTVPNLSRSGVLEYVRRPWGAYEEGLPAVARYSLEGDPGWFAANERVYLYSGGDGLYSDVAQAQLLGSGRTGAAGEVDFDVASGDQPSVFVATVDDAGNLSDAEGDYGDGVQATAVRFYQWVATMVGKVPGSVHENPHVFSRAESRFTHDGQAIKGPSRGTLEVSEIDGVLVPGDDPMSVTAAGAWIRHDLTSLPAERDSASVAYDIGRERTVMFGGRIDSVPTDETWELELSGWSRVCTADCLRPAARYGAAMAYDGARGVSVLFGGTLQDGTYADDTWEWNGSSWREVCDYDDCSRPSVRSGAAMVYDAGAGVALLVGGYNGASYIADTWAWSGTAWQRKCGGPTACTNPTGRAFHGLAYDMSRDVTVLFGGYTGAGEITDTWEWNGAGWRERCTSGGCELAANHPSNGLGISLAYDALNQKTVAFGGQAGFGSWVDKTWEWNGSTWTQRCTTAPCSQAANHPSARAFHGLVYDQRQARVVAVGGVIGMFTATNDKWLWDGQTWTRWCHGEAGCEAPAARTDHAMAGMIGNGVLLYGGKNSLDTKVDDTWIWNGFSWRKVCTASPCADVGNHPAARTDHGMADLGTGFALLFGGNLGPMGDSDETWRWNGVGWTNMCSGVPCTSFPRPGVRTDMAMSGLPGTEHALVFGGLVGAAYLDDTWEWSVDHWVQRCTSSPCSDMANHPSQRGRAAMALDSGRGVVVLFGGQLANGTMSGETWEWTPGSPGSWAKRCATGCSDMPTARMGHVMWYDPVRSEVVLYGGTVSSVGLDDSWSWDGTRWRRLCGSGTSCNAPGARRDGAAAWDNLAGQGVFFGGRYLFNMDEAEPWLWREAPYRPAHLWEVDVGAARVAGIASCGSDLLLCPLRGIDLSWYLGGDSDGGPGASIWVDQRGAWTFMATAPWDSGAPGPVISQLSDLDQLPRSLSNGFLTPSLYVAATTVQGTGYSDAPAVLTSDYVEATVRYRKPYAALPVFSADFDAGLGGLTVLGEAALSTSEPRSGTQAVRLGGGGGSVTSGTHDTSGCAELAFEVFVKRGPDAPEVGDTLQLEGFDGAQFQTITTMGGTGTVDSYRRISGRLDGAESRHAAYRLRVSTSGANPGADQFFVDDLRLVCLQ